MRRSIGSRPALLLGCALLAPAASAGAVPPLVLDGEGRARPLGAHLELLEDREGRWSVRDVTAPALAARFRAAERAIPNFGLTRSVWWARLRVRNASAETRTGFLSLAFPLHDLVELFRPRPDGSFEVQRSGDHLPFDEWPVAYREPAFRVSMPAGAEETLHLRLESLDTFLLDLTWWPEPAFASKRRSESFVLGLFYGALAIMIASSLLTYGFMRDPSYLYFGLFVAGFLLWRAAHDGLPHAYLTPDTARWSSHFVNLGGVFTVIPVLAFTRSFLRTPALAPRLDRAMRWAMAGFVLLGVWALFGPSQGFTRVMIGGAMLGGLLLLTSGVVCLRRGYRPARFYLAAWFLGITASLGLGLWALGLAPTNPFVHYGVQLGGVLTSSVFAMGLVHRFSLVNDDLERTVREREGLLDEVRDLNTTLEERIRWRTGELEAANRHKSEFLANMSHELRTPLNAVIGFSEVLNERVFGELEPKQAEYVADIHGSGRHLLALINDILELSRIEAGRLELDLATIDPLQAIQCALESTRARAGERGIRLASELDPALGTIRADERQLTRVIGILLSNAVKFTPEDGAVTVRARREGVRLVIEVEDTGTGVPPEDRELIFEAFRQARADDARKRGGTGLGLALARRLVEAHGGDLSLASEPGSGSTFRVELPAESPAAEAA